MYSFRINFVHEPFNLNQPFGKSPVFSQPQLSKFKKSSYKACQYFKNDNNQCTKKNLQN